MHRLSATRLWCLLTLLAALPLLPGCIGPCGEDDYPAPAPCSTPVTVRLAAQGPAVLAFADGHVALPAGQLWELNGNVYDGQKLLIDYQPSPAAVQGEFIDPLPGITLTCLQEDTSTGGN